MPWVVLIAAIIAGLDQLTKWWVVHSLQPDESRVVIAGFFDLVNWRNTGAAWGMFRNHNLVFTVILVLALATLVWFRHSFQLNRPSARIALGLMLGGIAGNLIDRLRVGQVIDFLLFYIGGYHWPAFNVADSAICVGVGLYVILTWRSEHDGRKARAAS